MRKLGGAAGAYHKLLITSTSVFCAAFLSASSLAHANLLTNESFETPVVTAGSFTTFATGSALITGWTVTGPQSTHVAIVSTSFAQAGVTFQAGDGIQWLDLTGAADYST